MNISFYLSSKANKAGEKQLFCRLSANGIRVEHSTRLKVDPKTWNQRKKQFRNRPELDAYLAKITSQITSTFTNAIADKEAVNEHLTGTELKALLTEVFDKKKVVKSNTFVEVYQAFMDARQAEVKLTTIKKYQTLRNLIQEYQEKYSVTLTFDQIDLRFYDTFTKFLSERPNVGSNRKTDMGVLNDTMSKNIGTLKTFMGWAYDRDYHSNTAYQRFKNKLNTKVDIVVLTEEELHQLATFDFRQVSDLEEHERELLTDSLNRFLFLAYTGQRFGDLANVSPNNIKDEEWTFKAQKTGKKTIVPFKGFIAPALAIAKAYNYRFPKISNQLFNLHLKEIGQYVGLTRVVSLDRNKGNETFTIEKPLFELLTAHTARRTCITLLIKKGVSIVFIQKLTNHVDVKTLMKYVEVNTDDLSKALENNM